MELHQAGCSIVIIEHCTSSSHGRIRRRRNIEHSTSDDHLDCKERGEGTNIQEQLAFQSGKKHVVIITEAASAGISLHADRHSSERVVRLLPRAFEPRKRQSVV
eukprot:6489599-Amphidinium_carterae.1